MGAGASLQNSKGKRKAATDHLDAYIGTDFADVIGFFYGW